MARRDDLHYDSGEEAARVYDRAMVRLMGLNTVTNFPVSEYARQLTEHQLKQLEVRLTPLLLSSPLIIVKQF